MFTIVHSLSYELTFNTMIKDDTEYVQPMREYIKTYSFMNVFAGKVSRLKENTKQHVEDFLVETHCYEDSNISH